jgi:hypothetical protein
VAFNTSIAGVLAIAATSNAASLSLTATPNPCVATSSRLVYTVNKDGTTSPFPCPEGYGLAGYVYTKSGIIASYAKPRTKAGTSVPPITFFLPSSGDAVQQMPLPEASFPMGVIAASEFKGENTAGGLIFSHELHLTTSSSPAMYTYIPSSNSFTDVQQGSLGPLSIDTVQIGNRLYHTVLKKYFPISSVNGARWSSLTSTKILEQDQILDMATGVSTPWNSSFDATALSIKGIPLASGGFMFLQGSSIMAVDTNANLSTYLDMSKTASDAVSIRKTKNGILIEGSKGNMYQIADGLSLTDAAPTVTSLPSSGYHITKFSAASTSNNIYFTAEDFQGNPFVGSQDLKTLKNTVYPGDVSKASEIQAVQ